MTIGQVATERTAQELTHYRPSGKRVRLALGMTVLSLLAADRIAAQLAAVDGRDGAQPAVQWLDDDQLASSLDDLLPVPSNDLVRLGAIQVSAIVVRGSSVLTRENLDSLTEAYTNRLVSLEELHELRHRLSQTYLARGFVNSGVIIPDQRVSNGIVVLEAIEGELTGIEVHGNRRLRERAIARRVARHTGKPLHINALQESLRVLEEDPSIERVNAQLLPGSMPGESYLRLAVSERPPFELEVTAANDRSPSVGEERGTAALTYRGLAGNGDALTGRVGLTEGVRDTSVSYRVPITAGGTAIEVFLADQETDIIEEPFDAIDIESRLKSWSIGASHPFIRQPDRALTGTLTFEHKRSESTLLGLPFSFSPGDADGKARGSAVSFAVEWTHRYAAQAWTARGTLQVGVNALDATRNAAAPDSDFVSFLGQVQYVRRMSWRDSRLLVRGLTQVARDPLLAMYKLPVGGRFSVRAYRENLFVRDNGAAASIEYQFPPLVDETARPRANLSVALFADYGVSWDQDASLVTSRKARIASAGVGLLWDPLPGLHTEIYWGADLDEQPTPTRTLQDRGFHYRLSFRKPF